MSERANGLVTFDNVGLRYGTEPEVLRDLSFTLFPGNFYFLTGASGAGKTSLLKMLYLAQRPSRGAIRMFGKDLITLPREEMPQLRRKLQQALDKWQTKYDDAARQRDRFNAENTKLRTSIVDPAPPFAPPSSAMSSAAAMSSPPAKSASADGAVAARLAASSPVTRSARASCTLARR